MYRRFTRPRPRGSWTRPSPSTSPTSSTPSSAILSGRRRRLLKAPEITEDEGRDILDLLLGVQLTVHPTAPLLKPAYEIAITPARPTVYDCCYLALADALGCRLVTADRKFHDALKTSPYGPRLLWVADPI